MAVTAAAVIACVAVVSACSGTTSTTPTASEAPPTSASPVASGWGVPVDWSQGRNVQGMDEGIPNPPGWYEAAFGPRTSEKIVYLTYDDGPSTTTEPLLALLAENDAKATFFVLGKQVEKYPSYIQKIVAGGHAIGDHTMNHDELTNLSSTQVRAELQGVRDLVGSDLGNCMRPPYGLIDTRVAVVSQQLNLLPIMWTGHAEDWNSPPANEMIEMLKKATSPGAVILLHDSENKQAVLEATKEMLPWWKAQGYRLETVPACRA